MRILWLVVFVVACGGGRSNVPDGGEPVPDAIEPDAAPLGCAATSPPTSPATSQATCNPLTQTGCMSGEKCTSIQVGATGRIGCTPDGTVQVGCACSNGTGAAAYDDCVKGSACVGGTCETVCDPQAAAAASGCDAQHACNRYSGLFDAGGVAVAGLCDPACDPLTQDLLVSPATAACGSPMPAQPTKGCYTGSFNVFSCAGVVDNARTDRQPPLTNGAGQAFINGCAPGFVPFFFESTGSMSVRCSGLCAPLEIDNTQPQNAKGDPLALGKLPLEASPAAGNATCAVGKKGSEAQQDCLFLWTFLTDANGNPGPSQYNETLGVCFAYTHFQFDSNNDGTVDTVFPACETLPPRSAATTGIADDAADFGCQKIAHSTKPAAMRDFRLGYGPGQAIAHTVR
jgi:hypothetical protein